MVTISTQQSLQKEISYEIKSVPLGAPYLCGVEDLSVLSSQECCAPLSTFLFAFCSVSRSWSVCSSMSSAAFLTPFGWTAVRQAFYLLWHCSCFGRQSHSFSFFQSSPSDWAAILMPTISSAVLHWPEPTSVWFLFVWFCYLHCCPLPDFQVTASPCLLKIDSRLSMTFTVVVVVLMSNSS